MKLVLPAILALALAATADGAEFHVAPKGSDAAGDGSAQKPFATPEKARDAVRASGRTGKEDVAVILHGGRYDLKATLLFAPEDSGSKEHPVVWRAAPGETPLLDGGRRVTGWKKVEGKPYWKASVPVAAGFPDWCWQFYVDGVRATVARSHTTLPVGDKNWWTDPAAPGKPAGIVVMGDRYASYRNPEDMRMLWVRVFKHGDLPVEGVAPAGPGRSVIKLRPNAAGWASWFTRPTIGEAFLVNAFEELDEPGEWYLDRKTRELFYLPRACEDMAKADTVLPAVDTLVRISGQPGMPVHHLRFEGIAFEHGLWAAMQKRMTGQTQAEFCPGGGTPGNAVPGQIRLDNAEDVAFTGCTLQHMGSCGITPQDGTRRVTIEGCFFNDLTAAAVCIGRFWVTPADGAPANVPTDIVVADNVVRGTGRDYPQGTGINTFLCKGVKILHNDVSDTSYAGLHARVGSGAFSPNIGWLEYRWNKVSRPMQGAMWGIGDGGSLYVHGRCHDSVVCENYSLYANRNENYEYYSDNFSHSITWSRNVSRFSQAQGIFYAWHPANVRVVFDGNYAERHGPVGHAKETNFHLVQNGQWPEEARRIMDNAGLEPKWRHLLDRTYGPDNLAQGKTVRASGEDPKHPARMGADGSDGSFCQLLPDAKGYAWWAVDLGSAFHLDRITLTPRQDRYDEASQKNLVVEGANDPSFAHAVALCGRNEVPWYRKPRNTVGAVGDVGPTNLWEQYLPGTLGAFRHVRVRSTSRGTPLSLAEVGVFGH